MGISAGIASLLTDVGVGAATAGDIAAVAAPALEGAGLGAGTAALTGGNAGTGALYGGLIGAAGPLANVAGLTSATTTGGALSQILGLGGGGGATTGAATSAAPDLGSMSGSSTLDQVLGMSDPGVSTPAAVATAANGATGSSGGIGGTLRNLAAIGVLANMFSKPGYGSQPTPANLSVSPLMNQPLTTTGALNRTLNPAWGPASGNWYTYGQVPETQGAFTNNQLSFPMGVGAARGGALRLARRARGGADGYVRGGGDGMSDTVPARLSDGEYVVNADVVSALGNGSNEKGAQRLDQMRRQVMRDRGTPRVVPKKVKKTPLQYLSKASG